MEFRSVSLMEKLTKDFKYFSILRLRLKNTLKQISPAYATSLELIERLPGAVLTYEGWVLNYAGALKEHSQTEESMFTRMCADLYTSLVDKCTKSQVVMFEKDETYGFVSPLVPFVPQFLSNSGACRSRTWRISFKALGHSRHKFHYVWFA